MSASYQAASWSIELAPGWTVIERDEYISIHSPSSGAELRLCTFSVEQTRTPAETWVETAAHLNRRMLRAVNPVQCGDFHGYATQFGASGRWFRGWMLRAGEFPLDGTYICAEADAGRDDLVVDSMFQTLRLHERSS